MIGNGSRVKIKATGQIGRIASAARTADGDVKLVIEVERGVVACSIRDVESLESDGDARQPES